MTARPQIRRSIPTRYADVLFRSKLEADWALAMDRVGMQWEFEKEGLQLASTFYLPDFYLPHSGQYLECKVLPTPTDVRKWIDLVQSRPVRAHTNPSTCPDVPLVIGQPHGVFYGYYRGPDPVDFEEFTLERAVPVVLLACKVCGGRWFGVESLSWRCQCCGVYSGRKHLQDIWTSPMDNFPRPEAWL